MTTYESKASWMRKAVPIPTTSPVAPYALVHAIQEAVQMVDDFALRPPLRGETRLAFQSKSLLALLCYCYTREIYGSADVEDVMRQDANFCHFCRGEVPDARIIHRFCRENREAVHVCLTAALRCLAETKLELGEITKVNEPQLAEEARRRVIMALFIDSMESNAD
jgi:transposase